MPPPVLIVSIRRGGILLGAFDDGLDDRLRLFDSRDQERRADAVVAHARRPSGRARRRTRPPPEAGAARGGHRAWGSTLIEWTYDPLQALNAHLNFAKLGVVVEEYEENIYGESSSRAASGRADGPVRGGVAADAPRTSSGGSAADGAAAHRDASVASAPVVNPSSMAADWLTAWCRPIWAAAIDASWSRFPVRTARCRRGTLAWRSTGGSRAGGSSRRTSRAATDVVDFFLIAPPGEGTICSLRWAIRADPSHPD